LKIDEINDRFIVSLHQLIKVPCVLIFCIAWFLKAKFVLQDEDAIQLNKNP